MATRIRRVKRLKRKKRQTQKHRKNIYRRRGGGYGKIDCPYIGKPWNGLGPPGNPYVEKPWYKYNDSNFYALSKYGIVPGGVKTYPGDKVYKKVNGGTKKRGTKKKKLEKNII